MTRLLALQEIQQALHDSAREVLARWLGKLGDDAGRIFECKSCGVKVWLPRRTTLATSGNETMLEQAERLHSRCGGAIQ
jgi:hypothetical protein